MERISSFFSHGLRTEKQNILLQHISLESFFSLESTSVEVSEILDG